MTRNRLLLKIVRACIVGVCIFAAERGATLMWPDVTPWVWWGGAAALLMIWAAVEFWHYRRAAPKGVLPFREAEARWLHQPGVGREAARLIMMAPTFREAEAVHDTFKAADRRLDASWAHYAFLYRLEMEGRGNETMAFASDIAEETGDDFIIDNEDGEWLALVSLYLEAR